MKIVHISLYPPKGELHCGKSGVAPYTKNLATNIPYNSNDKVYIIGDIDDKKETYIEDNIEVRKVFSKGVFFYKNIFKEIEKIQPDVVHIQQELALYGNILSAITLRFLLKKLQKKGITIITTFHSIVDIDSIDRNFMKENFSTLPIFMVKFAFKFIFIPLIKYSDKVVVYEKVFKKRILEQYHQKNPSNIYVVPHGIEDFTKNELSKESVEKQIGVSKNTKILLFMGYITGYKGIDLLIEGVERYKDFFGNDFKLFILGAHHPRLKHEEIYKTEYYRLKEKAEKALGENVDWQEGFVDAKKAAIYYSISDMVIFPYTRYVTSGPMSISIGYETPFLASNVFSEELDNNLLIFKQNPNDLAEKLNFFFNNKEKYNKIISKIKEERLWNKIGEKVYNLYNNTN